MAHKVGLKRVALGVVTLGASEVFRVAAKEGKKLITPKIPGVAALPKIPTTEDPSVAAAKEKLRLSEKKRKGRRASVLTSSRGVEKETGIIKRSAALGANPEKLATV